MKPLSLPTICLLALAPGLAAASIIPIGTALIGSGSHVWNYQLQLIQDQGTNIHGTRQAMVPNADVNLTSSFTIYDFAGYLVGSCTAPSGWTCTQQDLGSTGGVGFPDDSAEIVNLTWAYTSGPVIPVRDGGFDLGNFSARSIYDTASTLSYMGRVVQYNGSRADWISRNVGGVQGPSAPAQVIPEPGTFALSGLAVLLLGLSRTGKQRRSSPR